LDGRKFRVQQTSKGFAFIVVVLLLIVILGAFALLFAWPVNVRYRPMVEEVFWDVDGEKVTTASVGVSVKAHVRIRATDEYVGLVILKIRKDIAFWFDSDYQTLSVPINLAGGEEKEFEIAFIPDKPTSGSLRGYFIEVDFKVTNTNWVMENSYPPRLKVT